MADIKTHCPFGCKGPKLDEHGYCRHLLGFTNDGQVYEPITPMLTRSRGQLVDAGRVTVNGKNPLPIPDNRILVNPEVKPLDNGVYHMAKSWVSDRVYVPCDGDRMPVLQHRETAPAGKFDQEPPSWALDMLREMGKINNRLQDLEEAKTAPEAELAGIR